jgi:hypothetical protein
MTDTFRVHLLAQHLKLAVRVLRKAPAFSSLVIAILALPPGRYSSKDASATFCRAILDRVTRLPGVKSASFSDGPP